MNTGGLSRRIVNVALAFVGQSGAASAMSPSWPRASCQPCRARRWRTPRRFGTPDPDDDQGGPQQSQVRRTYRACRNHRPGHPAEHRVRDFRRRRRRIDHEAVPRRHRSGISIAIALCCAWWWQARKEDISSPPRRSGGIGACGCRRRLGPRVAFHHRVRPEIRLFHTDRSSGRCRRLFAVRRNVCLSRIKVSQLYGVFVTAAMTTSVIMFLVPPRWYPRG